MKINLKNGEFLFMSKEFPMNIFEIQDTLDRLKITDDKPIVEFSISEYDNMELSYTLCRRAFSADIYRLNLFAERLENLDFSEMTAFKSLLIANPECSFEDMLKMTYGLDSVMIYPCKNCCELGETVIENEMIPEIESWSDEIMELIDREKVGQIMQTREGGVFIDGHYCVTSGYEPPDINIEIGRPDNCFFRLLIAPIKANDVPDYGSAQWISLPFDNENQDIDFWKMTCVKRESSLPSLSQNQMQKEKIYELNELARSLSELSYDDFVKLKAVMEAENICEISDTLDCIGRLDEYQFDRRIFDQSDFGRAYLTKNLPADFDSTILENADLFDFGQEVLMHKHGEITSYGAVSGRGQELYSVLTAQSTQQLDEEFEEDYVENFEMEIGGLSL